MNCPPILPHAKRFMVCRVLDTGHNVTEIKAALVELWTQWSRVTIVTSQYGAIDISISRYESPASCTGLRCNFELSYKSNHITIYNLYSVQNLCALYCTTGVNRYLSKERASFTVVCVTFQCQEFSVGIFPHVEKLSLSWIALMCSGHSG